ncbi:MAG: LamG-like jellyroll fold domain-containing protein [Sedimentisphaeraceae bacterium JB056]
MSKKTLKLTLLVTILLSIFSSAYGLSCRVVNFYQQPVYASWVNIDASDVYDALGIAYGSALEVIDTSDSSRLPAELVTLNGVDKICVYLSLDAGEVLDLSINPASEWLSAQYADWQSVSQSGLISNGIISVSFDASGIDMSFAGSLGTAQQRAVLDNVYYKGWIDEIDNGAVIDPEFLGLCKVDSRSAVIDFAVASITAEGPTLTLTRSFDGFGQGVVLTETITALKCQPAFRYELHFTNNNQTDRWLAWADGYIGGNFAHDQSWLRSPYWGDSLYDLSVENFADHVKYWYNPPSWTYCGLWDDAGYGVGLTTLELLTGSHYHNKTYWKADLNSFALDQVETTAGYLPIQIAPGATVELGGCFIATDSGTDAFRQTNLFFYALDKDEYPDLESSFSVNLDTEFINAAKADYFYEDFSNFDRWFIQSGTAAAITEGGRLTIDDTSASVSCALEIDFSDQKIFTVDIADADPLVTFCAKVRPLGSTFDPVTLVEAQNVQPPDEQYLLAHYKFDETAGSVAVDSSSQDEAAVYNGQWYSQGVDQGCIYLDGTSYVRLPAGAVDDVTDQVTVSLWAYGDPAQSDSNVLFHGTSAGYTGHTLFAYAPDANGDVSFEAGHITPQDASWPSYYWGWDTLDFSQALVSDYRGQWNHYAFVKDSAQGYQKIYRNGELVAQIADAFSPVDSLVNFTLGCVDRNTYRSLYYKGYVDDLRIYNTALTDSQVVYLADQLSGSELVGKLQANINDKTGWSDYTSFELILSLEGQPSGSADINLVSILPPAAAAPELVTPLEGWDVTDLAACFSWKNIEGIVDYQLQISRDEQFTSPLIYDLTSDSELCRYYPIELLDTGLWYWRVCGVDGLQLGNFSEVRSFTINDVHGKAAIIHPVSAQQPLFTLEAFKVDDLSKYAESIPADIRHCTAIVSDNQYFVYKQTNLEHYSKVAGQDTNYMIRTHGPDKMGWAFSLTDVEWLFSNYPNIIGICVGENFWNYWQWETDGSKEYISRLIKLCAKYGRLYIWGDGNGTTFKWQQYASNDYWINFLAEYGEYMTFSQKNNINHTMHTTQGTLMGLWLSGRISNLGSWSECWYWNDAGFAELGVYLGPKMGYIEMFPKNYYNLSFVHGITQGASVFNVDGQGTMMTGTNPAIWDREGNTTEMFGDYIVPFIRGVVEHGLVPSKQDVLNKVKVAIEQPDRFENIAHEGDYGIYQLLYDQTYGFREEGKWYEYFPNTSQYYYFPLLPYGISSLGDGIRVETLNSMSDPAFVSSVFDAEYPGPWQSSALCNVVGESIFIQNTNENVDVDENYVLDFDRCNIKRMSGYVGPHKYIMGTFEQDDTVLWLQANTEFTDRDTVITFDCLWKPALRVEPASALVSAVWDSENLTYTLTLSHTDYAAEITLDSADLFSDGFIDYFDIFGLAENWLFSGVDITGDLDGDERVSLGDYSILSRRILTSDWKMNNPVLITEIGTGDDFFELQNVASRSVDTSGWKVLVNDGCTSITAVEEGRFLLPGSIEAGEVVYSTDEATDNYFGSGICWQTDGSGWILLLDSSGQMADFVCWGYASGDIEALTVATAEGVFTPSDIWQGDGIAYGGQFTDSYQRAFPTDNNQASDFTRAAPTKGISNL